MRALMFISLLFLIGGCSDDQQEEKGHVWQEQTETIQKAEDVNKLIMETDQKHRDAIDRQSQ